MIDAALMSSAEVSVTKASSEMSLAFITELFVDERVKIENLFLQYLSRTMNDTVVP